MPKEVAGCFTEAAKYGRFVISSGPYMIDGSDKLDASSCDKVAASPISGFDGEKQLTLVRNPAYDAKTDSPKARENFPDCFTFTVNTNIDDIYAKIARGDIEDEIATRADDRAAPVPGLGSAQDVRRRPHLVPDHERDPCRRSTTCTCAAR